MHKKLRVVSITICLILVGLVLNFNSEQSKADTNNIIVDDDYNYPEDSDGSYEKPYTTIQAAINNAEDGDSIFVISGMYWEDLTIDKSVTLTAQDITNTFIASSSKRSYMIEITADLVSIEGFRIWDSTPTLHRKGVVHIFENANETKIIGNIINQSDYGYGIKIENVNNAVIQNNIINNTCGIYLSNSNSNTIIDNSIQNSTGSTLIRIYDSNHNVIENNILHNSDYGIDAHNSNNNNIEDNEIDEVSFNAISFSDGLDNIIHDNVLWDIGSTGIDLDSSDSEVSENTIYDCNIGVRVLSSNSIIKENVIKKCTLYGLNILSGVNNQVFNNAFTYKYGEYHGKDSTAIGANKWYNQSLRLGNYWSDFFGPDPGNINNTVSYDPINVPEIYKYKTGGVVDKYPTGKYNTPPVVTLPSPTNLKNGVSLTPSLSVKVEDANDDTLTVEFFYVLENISYKIETVNNVVSGNRASVPFYSTIQGRNAVYTYLGTGYDYICEWYVNVTDKYTTTSSLGASNSRWIFITMSVPDNNKKPIADIGEPYEEYKNNESIYFDASNSNDPDGNIIFYRWVFGDGESVTNVKSLYHTYEKPGVYNVSLVVIDNNGSSDTETYVITIEKADEVVKLKPNADAGGPYSGRVNTVINFNASASSDKDGMIVSYEWEFGDDKNGTGVKTTHTYSSPGEYYAILTVEDDDGLTSTRTVLVTITKPPVKKDSPGFESLLVFLVIALFLAFRKYKLFKN